MNGTVDKDLFTAQTIRHVTLVLLYGFLGLIISLIVSAFLPYAVNDKILSIVNPLVTGVLSLTSGAVGYWIGHRSATAALVGGDDAPTPLVPPTLNPEKQK